jgi:hypothetical protein
MPVPQQQFAVRNDDPPDPLDLARIVSLVFAQADRDEPEGRWTVGTHTSPTIRRAAMMTRLAARALIDIGACNSIRAGLPGDAGETAQL